MAVEYELATTINALPIGLLRPSVRRRTEMERQEELKEIVIYDAPGRKIEVRVRTGSLWLSLTQIAVLFGVNKPAISKHLNNIYASGELEKQATISKMETVQTEGGRFFTPRQVSRAMVQVIDPKKDDYCCPLRGR